MRLLFLALVFLLSVLAACDEGSGVEDTTLSALSSTTDLMTETTTTAIEEPTTTERISTATTTMEQTTTEEMISTTIEEAASSTTEMLAESTKELATTTKDPLRKWNHEDIELPFETKEKPCAEKEVIQMDEPVSPCPEGWLRYKESCYLIKKKLATMEMASKTCQNFDTTLFVADDQEEFDVIAQASVPGRTWLLFRKDELSTDWQAGCGIDTEKLPWLVQNHEYHGWNQESRCAFMRIEIDRHLRYTHFSPCRVHMNFICERNATLYLNH